MYSTKNQSHPHVMTTSATTLQSTRGSEGGCVAPPKSSPPPSNCYYSPLDAVTPTCSAESANNQQPNPQQQHHQQSSSFYFMHPTSTVSVDFEPVTLPLLFSPLEVYQKYYVAMRRIHYRKGSELERINGLYMHARHCFKEGRFMAVVDALQEACLRRRELFVPSDFQVCMAYEHAAWTALHLALIRLAEAPSFPEGKGLVQKDSDDDDDDVSSEEDPNADDGNTYNPKKRNPNTMKGRRVYHCKLSEVPALFSACEQIIAACHNLNTHVGAASEKEWVVGGGLPSFGAATVVDGAASGSGPSNRTARNALTRATATGASKITLPNRTLLQFAMYHNWANYWIGRRRWRTAAKHARLAEERYLSLLCRGWVSSSSPSNNNNNNNTSPTSTSTSTPPSVQGMDSISSFRVLLRLRSQLTQVRSDTSNESMGHGALPGSLFSKPPALSPSSTSKSNKSNNSNASASMAPGNFSSSSGNHNFEACFSASLLPPPTPSSLHKGTTTSANTTTTTTTTSTTLKLVSIASSKAISECSPLLHTNLLPSEFPVIITTTTNSSGDGDDDSDAKTVDIAADTANDDATTSSASSSADSLLLDKLTSWLAFPSSKAYLVGGGGGDDNDEDAAMKEGEGMRRARDTLRFTIRSPDLPPQQDPHQQHHHPHNSDKSKGHITTTSPQGGGDDNNNKNNAMTVSMSVTCTSPIDDFAKPSRWSITDTLIPFYYHYVAAVSQVAVSSGGTDRAWQTQRRKATIGLAHLAACAAIIARDKTPLPLIQNPPENDQNDQEEENENEKDNIAMITSVNPIWWEKGVLALRRRLLGALESTKEMEQVERDLYADSSSALGGGGDEDDSGAAVVLEGGSSGLHPVLAAQRNSTHTNTRNNVSLTISKVMKDYVLRERAQKRRLKEEARLRRLMLEDEEGDEEIVDGIDTSKIIVANNNNNNNASSSSAQSKQTSGGVEVRCKWMLEPTVEETRGLVQDIVSSSTGKGSGGGGGGADLAGWWCSSGGGGATPSSSSSSPPPSHTNNNSTTTTAIVHNQSKEGRWCISWPVFLSELHHIPRSWQMGGDGIESIKSLPYYPSLVPATAPPPPSNDVNNNAYDASAAAMDDVTTSTSTSPPPPPFVSAAAVYVAYQESFHQKKTIAADVHAGSSSMSFAQKLDMGRSKQRQEEQSRKKLLDKRHQQRHRLIPLSRFQNSTHNNNSMGQKGGTTTTATSTRHHHLHHPNNADTTGERMTPTRFNASAPLPPLSRNPQLEPNRIISGGNVGGKVQPPARDAVTGQITGWEEETNQEVLVDGTLRAEDISAITNHDDHDDVHSREDDDDVQHRPEDDDNDNEDDGPVSEQMYLSPERGGPPPPTISTVSQQPMMLGDVASTALRARAEKRRALQQQITNSVSFAAPHNNNNNNTSDEPPSDDVFEVVHAELVDTLIELKRNQDAATRMMKKMHSALEEEEQRQRCATAEEAEVVVGEGEERRFPLHQPAVDDGNTNNNGAPGDAVVAITNADQKQDVQVPGVNSLPIHDMEVNRDGAHQDDESIPTIVGHLRDPATSDQLHRLSLFEVTSMPYDTTTASSAKHQQYGENGNNNTGSGGLLMVSSPHYSASRCSRSSTAVSRTASNHHNATHHHHNHHSHHQTSPSRKLAAATGFAATLMQGPYKLRPSLQQSPKKKTLTSIALSSSSTTPNKSNHSAVDDNMYHPVHVDEGDDEDEEEDEEHYLRRVARPKAIIPPHATSYAAHQQLSSAHRHDAPSTMLLLGGATTSKSSPQQHHPHGHHHSSQHPRFPALVRPPHITTTNNNGASTPLSHRHRQKVVVAGGGGVTSSSSPTSLSSTPGRGGGGGHSSQDFGNVDLNGIVPRVRALLSRQDTLRTMLLTLDSKSDAALYMSVNAELRGNEAEVGALRHEMHQLRRAAATAGGGEGGHQQQQPRALQPISRRV